MKAKTVYIFIVAMLIMLSIGLYRANAADQWRPNGEALNLAVRGQVFDLTTTGVALSGLVVNATEMNPMGIAVVPLKIAATYGMLPLIEPSEQVTKAKEMSDIAYGFGMTNLATLAGEVSLAGPVGMVSGMYLLLCDQRGLPLEMCPFSETVREELDRRIKQADEEGRELTGFVLNQNEAWNLKSELGYLPDNWRGYTIEVIYFQPEEPVLFYDRS